MRDWCAMRSTLVVVVDLLKHYIVQRSMMDCASKA